MTGAAELAGQYAVPLVLSVLALAAMIGAAFLIRAVHCLVRHHRKWEVIRAGDSARTFCPVCRESWSQPR